MTAAEFKRRFMPLHYDFYQTAFRLTGNLQDAEDMVQDTYLKLWRMRDSVPSPPAHVGYCKAVLRHVCIDHLRQHHFKKVNEDSIAETDDYSQYLIETREQAAVVLRTIRLLPQQQRLAVTLHDVRGYSYKEIEQLTGQKETTVRVLLSRARKRIRELINDTI